MSHEPFSPTLALTQELIARASITPFDAGCQELLAERLTKINFQIEKLRFADVDNLWATHGTTGPTFVFIGHTDVVPPGPKELWTSDPFEPEIREGLLYGRGAADMKSGLAAMVIAYENFVAKYPKHKGIIALLITSDEEGQAINGTKKMVEYLQQQNKTIDWCIVGEASSEHQLGDTIKIGRRGSLNGKLIIHGKQGHIAYPQLAENPIHNAMQALGELCKIQWDQGNDHFQPTSFQISNIMGGTGADNVIPGTLEIVFNFRFSTEVTAEQLQEKVYQVLDAHKLQYQIDWRLSGNPFLTVPGTLVNAVREATKEITAVTPKLSTTGGTSDGRFMAQTGCQVVELGPCNASIHKIDEHINIDDLNKLTQIYFRILELLLI